MVMTPSLRLLLSLSLLLVIAPLPLSAQVVQAERKAPSRLVASTRRPASAPTSIVVNVNTLANRHPISEYIYGSNFPASAAYITQAGSTLTRWGGNNSSRYNWKNHDTNLDADWYFENNVFGSGTGLYASSESFLLGVSGAGGSPILTIPMLSWVAKNATSTSFSIAKYGNQCAYDPYRPDNGDGLLPDCTTALTNNDPNDAHVPLLDSPSSGDPAGSVYRSEWIAAVKSNFGPHPHFYNLDNEPDIWAGTHRDVHPAPAGYDELAATFLARSRALKTFDTQAIRFGPTFCCWWFYWNGANSNDKAQHAGLDFLPWWLNEVNFQDQAAGIRSLDVFDVHAYYNGPSTTGLTTAQIRAAALRETRDWWDANYISENGTVNQPWATQIQPNHTVGFVIPRMRALANTFYPNSSAHPGSWGTPVAFTEWNGAMAGESDFSTALVDADSYGILGRERMWAATRWTAASQNTPAFSALLLYRNADGKHNGFQGTSVEATNNGDPNLFSTFAATDRAGKTLTLMVVNKDPASTATVTFNTAGFNPSQMKTYTLSSTSPTTILASGGAGWSATQSFAPYSATLIVVTGTTPQYPKAEWELNPDTLAAPASSTVTIAPGITSGTILSGTLTVSTPTPQTIFGKTGSVTLTSATSTAGLGVTLTQPKLAQGSNGLVTLQTPATPGFYQFTVTGIDNGGLVQSKQGWVLVGNPAASLTKTGDNQAAAQGTKLTLTANFLPGSSGASSGNVSVLFKTSAGILSSQVVRTNGSGQAAVTLTLPSSPGKVVVTAQAPIPWGGAIVTFTETAQ